MASSRRKIMAFYFALVATNVLLFLIVEGAARIYFATQVGSRVLFYGTERYRLEQRVEVTERQEKRLSESPQTHSNNTGDYVPYVPDRTGSYSKYFPNEPKIIRDPDTRARVPARINSQGFRGEDFELKKPPGVVRVLTLGASSTFGYGNRDEQTYPYQMEQILNERSGGRPTFEVINFAIPHATTDNILAMFLAEGARLDPDFVTIYSGANDSAIGEHNSAPHARLWRWLHGHFVTLELVDQVLKSIVQPSPYRWSDEYAEKRSRAFRENLQTLLDECRSRGIGLIVATQQLKSGTIEPEEAKGLTYEEEVALVRARTTRGRASHDPWLMRSSAADGDAEKRRQIELVRVFARMMDNEPIFLIHSHLMADLREWASQTDVGFVDLIHALDGDRDRYLLANWVHLRPEGNRVIGEVFADTILELQAAPERPAR